MLKNVNKLNKFIRERNKFSNDTFGTPEVRNCIYPLKHLQEEVQELIDNADDPMEWADCFLLLLDAAWRKGYDIDDLVEFSSQKLKINKKRKWDKKADGMFKHVEDEADSIKNTAKTISKSKKSSKKFIEDIHKKVYGEITGKNN